jgi:2-isopropylmalate synthase
MGINCISDEQLRKLTEISRHIAEIANLPQSPHQPFVGRSAFSHKGGIHVSAVVKHPGTYEHIAPEKVGNERRVTISELSGVSNLLVKAEQYGIKLKKEAPETKTLVSILKEMESQGYFYEEGEASFELLVKRTLGMYAPFFQLEEYKVETEKLENKPSRVVAHIRIKVRDKHYEAAAEGDGPVNALDNALRKVLEGIYPEVKSMKLTDYKVRVLNTEAGTAARVRVTIESADEKSVWNTVGVSENVIEASWQALVDAFEFKLLLSKF